jgi:hypothetical protein
MPIANLQVGTKNTSASGTATPTLSSTTAGSLLVAVVGLNSTGFTTTGPTNWVKANSSNFADEADIFYLSGANNPGGQTSFAFTSNGGGNITAAVSEWSGADPINPVDVSANGSTTAVSATSTVAGAKAGDLAVTVLIKALTGVTFTAGSGWSDQLDENAFSGGAASVDGDYQLNVSGTVSDAVTATGASANWDWVIVCFKAAPAAATFWPRYWWGSRTNPQVLGKGHFKFQQSVITPGAGGQTFDPKIWRWPQYPRGLLGQHFTVQQRVIPGATGPNVFTQALTAILTFTGPSPLTNAVTKGLASAALTFTGPTNLKNAITKILTAASLTFTGAFVKFTSKLLAGATLTFTGAISAGKQFTRALTATLTFTGPTNLVKNINKSMTGTLTFTGPAHLLNAIQKGISGVLTFTGVTLKNVITKGLAVATLTFTGALIKSTNKALVGAILTFTGATLVKQINKTLTGVLTFTGPAHLLNSIVKNVTGVLTFAGALRRAIITGLTSATLTFTGAITKSTRKFMTGALSFIGNLVSGSGAHQFTQALSAALTFTGAITKQTNKNLASATLTFTGLRLTNFISKVFHNAYEQTIMNDGPVAYWRLDDAGPSIQDFTGNGNTGTIQGSLTTGVLGGSGDGDTAISFPGTASNYISIPYQASLAPSLISLECLINFPSNPSSTRCIVDDAFVTLAHGVQLQLTNTGTVATQLYGTGGGSIFSSALTANVWHQVIATYDGTQLRLYIDGILAAGPTTLTYSINAGSQLQIGRHGSGTYYPGLIDEVAIYNYALTQTQVTAHFNAMVATPGLSFVGSFVKATTKTAFAATLTFTGNFVKQAQKSLKGVLTFTGPTALVRQFGKSFKAALSFVGNLLQPLPPGVAEPGSLLMTLPANIDLGTSETYPYGIDLTNYLSSGDTIGGYYITMINLPGAQPVASPWRGTVTFNGNVMTIPLLGSAFQQGQKYQMNVTFVANTNKIVTFITYIHVVN